MSLIAGTLTWAGTSHAQDAETSAGASQPTPSSVAPVVANSAGDTPDLVRLKNGGLLRGKIVELLPGETVTIVTPTGKTREIPFAEVDYAGPAPTDSLVGPDASAEPPSAPESVPAPNPTPPGPTPTAPVAELELSSVPPGITYHLISGDVISIGFGNGKRLLSGHRKLCTAPCTAAVPVGRTKLALSGEDDSKLLEVDPVNLREGPSVVSGTIESRAGVRALGWIILIGGTVGGTALALTSGREEKNCVDICGTEVDTEQMVMGTLLAVSSLGLGIGLAAMSDKATIQVTPRGGTNRMAARPPLLAVRGGY